MIRTAISPRLATSTRRKGGPVGSSLCKDGASSERDVAMLLSRVDVSLVAQHLEGADEPRPGFRWADDGIDVPARRRDIRIGKFSLVLGDEAATLRRRILGGSDR